MQIKQQQQNKKWVWIPHTKESFVAGYIESTKENEATVITQNNEKHKVPLHRVYKMNPSKFNMAEDLALLSHLNEPSVLFNLRQRYEHDLIYTYSGLFLLSINPYKELKKLYAKSIIEEYQTHYRTSKISVNAIALQPHIFAFANSAYNSLLLNKENQSILITGESGAGKTVNTRRVIQFLASIAKNVSDTSYGDVSISDKILETNVVLEAFGNAQTIKNDNSSRFGKFIKIEFVEGKISGAHIEKYLLEKSRVTRVNKSERNYHVFYQLIKSMGKSKGRFSNEYDYFMKEIKKEALFEDDVRYEDFNYLKGTNSCITNVDDLQEFFDLNAGMDKLGFCKDEKLQIFKILSAILHLGNLQFSDNDSRVVMLNEEVAQKVCTLLSISLDKFTDCLLNPMIQAGSEKVINSRNVEQVYQIIEALSRMLYERMFEKIIEKINNILSNDVYNQGRNTNFIGVLDIAGFEIYQKNDFEQLCINYTNEKLQQFFNHHMFILEQEIYKKENIDWNFIDFGLDLQPTIDLIEKNNPIGIFSYLDEECVMPKGTDETFLSKLTEITQRKITDISKTDKSDSNNLGVGFESKSPLGILKLKKGFLIEHYAGRVEYIVNQWLKKNKDPHFEYLSAFLRESNDRYVREIFTFNSTGKKGFFRTVVQKHKDSLNMLMTQLRNTNPFFVRCILPNTEKKSNFLDNKLILNQLKCNGVMEGIRISRQGYPTRILFREFRKRYSILCDVSKTLIDNKESSLQILETIEAEILRNSDNQTGEADNQVCDISKINNLYKIGNTMIFFKQGVLAEIEDMRDRKLEFFVTKLQSHVQARIAYKRFSQRQVREKAILVIQKNARLSLGFMKWGWWKLYLKVKPLLEMTKFENELEIKNKEIERAQALTKSESIKNENLKENLMKAEKERQILAEKNESKRAQLAEKEDLLNALRNENQEMIEKLKEAHSLNMINSKELTKKNEENEKINKVCIENQEKFNKIKNDLISVQVSHDELKKEKSQLLEKLATNEAEMKNVNIKNKSETQKLLVEKEKMLLQAQQVINEIEKKLKNSENNSKNLINDLSEKLQKISKENEELVENQKQSEIKLTSLNENMNSLTKNKSKLEKDVKILGESIEKLTKECEDLNFENSSLESNQVKLENKFKRLDEECEELKQKNRVDAMKLVELANENQIIKRERDNLVEELEDERSRKLGLSQCEESHTQKIKSISEENKRLLESLSEKENLVALLKNTIENLTKENENRLQSKLDDFFEKENEYKKIIKEQRMKMLQHENELYDIKLNKEAEIDNKTHEAEIQKRKKYEILFTEEENKNVQLKNTIASLQIERDDLLRKNRLNEEKCVQLENNNGRIVDNVKEIERLKGIINQRITDHNKVFDNMLQRYRKDNDSLNMATLDLQESNKRLQNENENLNKIIKETKEKFNADHVELEQKIEQYCREIGAINSEYKSLHDENIDLKNRLHEKEVLIKKERNKTLTLENIHGDQEQKLKERLLACERKILEQNNKINYQSGRNTTLENKLISINADMNKASSYLCDHCSIDKCICDSNCVIKCTSDFASTKKIEDLKLTLENERFNYTSLNNKYERLSKTYEDFSKEYETLAKKQNENHNLIVSMQKKIQIANEHIALKSEQLVELQKESDSKKRELDVNNATIKNLSIQIDDLNNKIEYLSHKASNNSQSDELMAEKNKNDNLQTNLLSLEKELLRSNDFNEKLAKKISERDEVIHEITNEMNKWQSEFLGVKKLSNAYFLKISQLERDLEEERIISSALKYNSIMKE